MRHSRFSLGQSLLVLVSFLAWFSISSHCVLGALISARATPGAVMHCHAQKQQPASGGADDTPCCKVLRAVVTKAAAVSADTGFVIRDYASTYLTIELSKPHGRLIAFDIGPPDEAISFSEAVLQRSLLAHAPPVLA